MASHSFCNLQCHHPHPFQSNPNIYQLSVDSNLDSINDTNLGNVCGKPTLTGIHLSVSRLYGLLVKKTLYCIRSRCLTAIQTMLPLCLMWIGLVLLEQDSVSLPKIDLTQSLDDVTAAYAVNIDKHNSVLNMADTYRDIMQSSGAKPVLLTSVEHLKLLGSSNLAMKRNYPGKHNIFVGAIFESVSDADNLSTHVNITALYNMQDYHSEPIAVAAVMKTLYHYSMQQNRNITLPGENVTEETLNLAILPLPLTSKDQEHVLLISQQELCMHYSILVLASMTFLMSMFAFILVQERTKGSKHLQSLAGVTPLSFYLSTLLFDLIVYTMECLIIFSPFLLFQKFQYMIQSDGITLLEMLMCYGVVSLPLVYSAQFLFQNATECVLVLFTLQFAAGTCLLVYSLESIYIFHTRFMWSVGKNLKTFLEFIFPSFKFANSSYKMCVNMKYSSCHSDMIICKIHPIPPCCEGQHKNNDIAVDFAQFIVLSTIFLLLDSEIMRVLRIMFHRFLNSVKRGQAKTHSLHEDDDVDAEHKKIHTKWFKEFMILKGIVKYYGEKRVLGNICLAFSKGECFCILGKEKTGKSTLMKIISGQLYPTYGNVLIKMTEILTTFFKAKVSMSYCPQTDDAIMNELTGRETLFLYGRLRGLSNTVLDSVTNTLLCCLRISDPDILCANYSNTNKRKISFAITVIGEPEILILDEPTHGIDYVDQKTAWLILSYLHKNLCNVIIATSNTEECTMLGQRMSIIHNGKLLCLASPSELCNKYGTGYTAIVSFLNDDEGNLYSQMPFLTFIIDSFSDVVVISDFYISHIHFSNENTNLGKLFAAMEDGVRYFHVEDYSVQKTSLNHVFYSMSVCPEEEYIEIPRGPSSSFDTWPPKLSSPIQKNQSPEI